METCINLLSLACQASIWEKWGSSIELTLSLWELAQIAFVVVIALLARKVYVDPIKRDIFFGYLPTAVIVLKDIRTGKFLLGSQSYHEPEDKEGVKSKLWFFPQSIMENADLTTETRRVAQAKLGLGSEHFRFTDRTYHSKRFKKVNFNKMLETQLGFSLFAWAKGRVYHVSEIEAEIEEREGGLYIMGKKLESMSLEEVKLVTKEEAEELIEKTYRGYKRREPKIAFNREILDRFA